MLVGVAYHSSFNEFFYNMTYNLFSSSKLSHNVKRGSFLSRLLKTLGLLLFLLTTCSEPTTAKGYDPIKYDITSAGSGTQGTYLVKVYVYSKNAKVSDEQLKFAAIHGVLFRGFEGKPSAPALAGSADIEKQKADYFGAFFGEEGAFAQYASVVTGSYERVKMSKGGYKVGAIVQVSKSKLQQELETAGVIHGLSSGF